MEDQKAEITSVIRDIHRMYIKNQISLLNALQERWGSDFAQTVETENCGIVCSTWLSKSSGEGSIEDFINLLWEPLRTRGFEFSIARTEGGVQIKCTVCPWAGLYRNLNGEDWGYRLYCAADEELVRRFNPKIGFRRTKTLMKGDDYCDHFYYIHGGNHGNNYEAHRICKKFQNGDDR